MPPSSVRPAFASSVRTLAHNASPRVSRLAPRVSQPISRRFKSGPYGYTQAKALVYSQNGEPSDVLSLHTHSISPSLPPTALLLRSLAAPINPADINQIQGVYPSRPPFTSLLGTAVPSAIAGNEACFEVMRVGSAVREFAPGDWAIARAPCLGTWRTHVEAQEDALLRVEKEGLTPVQVGTVGVNPTTAYRMLKDFENVEEGEWFIQNGANSGVGRAAIQLGRLWGMKSINIIRERGTEEETEAMRNELRGLGATHVVTEGELMGRGFSEQVKEWTVGGRQKVKLGLNCVGGKPTSAMVKCLSDGGHLVTYGGMAKAPLQVPTAALIFKDVKFSGFWVSRWSEKNLDEKRRTVGEILELTRAGMFADVPVQKVQWDWDTKEETLKEAVMGTLQGFRKGKGVFVFGDT
ncbi:hypothetical protein V500_03024 [Pseudogymnoascus sp. VKM F-4518 (FW-2643)]|nr:hypothetical protein V500_03024 [Pseudogymnoascus sp. VKM F-4518 (FW-2643)]